MQGNNAVVHHVRRSPGSHHIKMDALEALHTRVSAPVLTHPIPTLDVLDNIFKAALRTPDHLVLKPWRFLVVSAEGRKRLGQLFAEAAHSDDADITQDQLQRERVKPMRAPLIVIAVAVTQTHSAVPEIEQLISAGAAVNNMMLSAHCQGIGAMWRTGAMAYHPIVKEGLGVAEHEQIVGFLYLGHVKGRGKKVPELIVSDFFKEWPQES